MHLFLWHCNYVLNFSAQFVVDIYVHSLIVREKEQPPYPTSAMKNDFAEKFHRFMSSLTDTRWKMDGKTVLYIPVEGKEICVAVAAQDKEYVQRMEGRQPILWRQFFFFRLLLS